MEGNDQFYKNIQPAASFSEALRLENHQMVPENWWIALTDVVNSTKAIEAGRYKDVNTAGGMAAMAIANIHDSLELPFIFGGDGITFLIPPQLHDDIHDVLYDTKIQAKAFFDLELRVGLIPVKALYEKGFGITVGKVQVSQHYNQAVIAGEGLQKAEAWIKFPDEENPYLIREPKNEKVKADFNGFTCRWEDIPSSKGETISTIILLREGDKAAALKQITQQLYEIFGTEEDFHPLTYSNLHVAKKEEQLGLEAKVLSNGSRIKYLLKLLQIKFEAWFVRMAIRFKWRIKNGIYTLSELPENNIAASDYRKYDGSFKTVLNCTPNQRARWEGYLKTSYQNGVLFYGLHIADRALMTCLLHAGSEKEVHFIDAADGGYALAAKQLKLQMASIES